MPDNGIKIVNLDLPTGNTIQVFLNTTTNLLVVDLIDQEGRGGNELVRMHLDEPRLLAHLNKENSHE